MLQVLFTQDSKVKDLIYGALSGSKPSLFFSSYLISLVFKPVQDDFQEYIRYIRYMSKINNNECNNMTTNTGNLSGKKKYLTASANRKDLNQPAHTRS